MPLYAITKYAYTCLTEPCHVSAVCINCCSSNRNLQTCSESVNLESDKIKYSIIVAIVYIQTSCSYLSHYQHCSNHHFNADDILPIQPSQCTKLLLLEYPATSISLETNLDFFFCTSNGLDVEIM